MFKKLIATMLSFFLCTGCFPAFSTSDIPWIPKAAPAVRNQIPEAELNAARDAILAEGKLLFSGKTNKGYYPYGGGPLPTSKEDDAIVLIWACDDVTHGGWGVLGLKVNGRQKDIIAVSDQPDRERLMVISVKELMTLANADSPEKLKYFSIGAWNGGRIAALYFLPAQTVRKLEDHLAYANETQKIIHTYDGQLSNKNAIPEARAVYAYLQEVWGSHCLTGQMESTWRGSPEYEMLYLRKHTGRLPAIRGLDFIDRDFQGVVNRSIQWWQKGGIPHICWHTGPDFKSGYNESLNHDLDWENALTPGTKEYAQLLSDMDRAVPYLQKLQNAGVPVLWRPFHELDGGWFWWSRGGAEKFVQLWQLMYSRYTDYWGLNNLIWVLGYSANGGNMAAWYPGDEYVDLIGADSYTPGANGHLYQEVASIAPEGMPIVFHECGSIPTEKEMKEASAPWLMFMVWHTDHLTDGKSNTPASLNTIYNSDYFITLDELPDF